MNRETLRRWTAATLVLVAAALPAHAQWIPTNAGDGADAEVRESLPLLNRGTDTELASRVQDEAMPPDSEASDRNSLIYVRFDLSAVAIPSDFETAFRLTYRNNNLAGNRIQDTVTPDPTVRTGLTIYGLDPLAAGADWDEATITYSNAPGLTPDGDIGTRDVNSDLIHLGEVRFPAIGTQNWLPVGGALIFTSAALDQFVRDALDGGATAVTLVAHTIHDGSAPFATWLNFNYLFNPKEQTTLGLDPNYDADITDPANPLGSPWSGADNSAGDFSPSLLIQEARSSILEVPVAGTSGLAILGTILALAGFVLLRTRLS
jgi:hypothetical protein